MDDENIKITLRQGSLIIDAKVNMPTSAGTPVTPTGRAVGRLLRDITGANVTIDEPRMAREREEDELWNTMSAKVRDIEDEYDREWPRMQGEDARRSRLPNRLDVSSANAHAHNIYNDMAERLARFHVKQLEMSPDMED